jgi:hypothetical protein
MRPRPSNNSALPIVSDVDLKYGPDFQQEGFKFKHLNLCFNQEGELSSPNVLRVNKDVSLFWIEKIRDLVFFFQLSGLLWVLGYNWWPQEWLREWSFVLLLNLEFVYLTDVTGTRPDVSGMYYMWTLLVLVIVLGVVVGRYVIWRTEFADEDLTLLRPREPSRVSARMFSRYYALALEVVYIPGALAALRTLCCRSDASEYWFIEARCFSAAHVFSMVLAAFIVALLLLRLPIQLEQACKNIVLTRGNDHAANLAEHERTLQTRELEYMMGISPYWETAEFEQITSFTRRFCYSRTRLLYTKLLLCAVTVLLGPTGWPSRWQVPVFGGIFFASQLAENTIERKYRCRSSEWMSYALNVSFLLQLLLGMLKADNFRSSFLVSSSLSSLMLGLNLITLALWIALGLFFTFFAKDTWPVVEADVRLICLQNPLVVEALERAKHLLSDAHIVHTELFPRSELVLLLADLKTALAAAQNPQRPKQRKYPNKTAPWIQANDPYTIPRVDKVRLLAHALETYIIKIGSLYTQIPSRFSQSRVSQERKQWVDLWRGIKGLRESVARKEHYRLAMRPSKRALFYKLLAVQTLLSGEPLGRPKWAGKVIALEEMGLRSSSASTGKVSLSGSSEGAFGSVNGGGGLMNTLRQPSPISAGTALTNTNELSLSAFPLASNQAETKANSPTKPPKALGRKILGGDVVTNPKPKAITDANKMTELIDLKDMKGFLAPLPARFSDLTSKPGEGIGLSETSLKMPSKISEVNKKPSRGAVTVDDFLTDGSTKRAKTVTKTARRLSH